MQMIMVVSLAMKVNMKSLSLVQLFATRGLQITKFLHPWDSPGKNTGVGCYFLLQGPERKRDSISLALSFVPSRKDHSAKGLCILLLY